MKKIFLFTFFSLCFSLVFSEENATLVKRLNKNEFLTYVYNFEENPQVWTAKDSLPFIIDFYEDWCGPCRMIAPILEELALEYKGRVNFYKVNTQYELDIKRVFGINRFPTLFFCAKGENPQLVLGAQSKETFKKLIDTVLLKQK